MTAGGLYRFHAVMQVRKASTQHEGLQRNVMAAAFGALKDLDLVIVVDDDIDIRDPADVEYALATGSKPRATWSCCPAPARTRW